MLGKDEKEKGTRKVGGAGKRKNGPALSSLLPFYFRVCALMIQWTLSFYNSCLGDSFWPKRLFDANGPFGDNVIKNPARYISQTNKIKQSKHSI